VIFDSEQQIETALDWCGGAASWIERKLETLDPLSLDAKVLLGELEHLKKATVQKGFFEGYFAPPPSPPEIELPQWYMDHLTQVLSLYFSDVADPHVQQIPEPQVVIDTSAGWPVFIPGIAAKVLSASFYMRDHSVMEARELAQKWATSKGLDHISAFANAYGTRLGTLSKFTRDWKPTERSFVSDSESISTHARRRQIYMAPIVQFLALKDFTRCAKATRKYRIPGAWHTGEDDTVHMMRTASVPGEWMEADISGYDTNVSRSHHKAFLDIWRRVHPESARWAEDYYTVDGMGTIFPHPGGHTMDNRSAMFVSRRGLLSSGMLPTAEMGNIYHLPIIFELAKRCGFKEPKYALVNGQFAILIQGDDLLIKMRGLTPEIMKDTYAEAGFTVKAVKALRFLMRHRLPTTWYPVGGRIIQQTMWGEHEPTGKWGLPLAVLGLAARWGDKGPHPIVKDLITEGLRLTNLSKHGVYDGPTANRWLQSDFGSQLLNRALTSLASSSWGASIYHDAPYSTSAAAIVELAARLGYSMEPPEQRLGNLAIQTMLALPYERRIAIRDRLWAAYESGAVGTDFDAYALQLLGLAEVE
jgi:hypothetical protein